jgi:hypothetical protein
MEIDKGGFMGKSTSLKGKELERAYDNFYEKTKAIKTILENLESGFKDLDITRCNDEGILKAFIFVDTTLDKALVPFKEGLKELEKIGF